MAFSLMFVPGKEKCLASIQALLKPGGRVIIVVLSKFGLLPCIGAGMAAVEPQPAEEPAKEPKRVETQTVAQLGTGPLSLANPEDLDKLVAGAGLATVSDEGMQYPFPLGPNREVARRIGMLIMKDPLTAIKEGGKEDAFDVFGDAFIGHAEAKGWVKAGQVIIPEDECCPRLLVAVRPSAMRSCGCGWF